MISISFGSVGCFLAGLALMVPTPARAQDSLVRIPMTGTASMKSRLEVRGRLVRIEISGGDAIELHVWTGRTQKKLSLAGVLQKVTDARIFDDKIIVLTGFVSNAETSLIVTVEVSSGRIIDKVLCYSPSVSPAGRYVAFVKFFPAHGLSSAEDHYALYDVSLTPAQNRPTKKPLNDATVGKIVYPPGLGNTADDNVEVKGRPLHQMAGEQFFWSDSGEWCIFADRVDNLTTVVVLQPLARRLFVSTRSFSDSELCGTEVPCVERIIEVKFNMPSHADITFRDFSGRSTKSLTQTISLPL